MDVLRGCVERRQGDALCIVRVPTGSRGDHVSRPVAGAGPVAESWGGPVAGPLRPHLAHFWDVDSTRSQGDEDEPVRVLIYLDIALPMFSLKLPACACGFSLLGTLAVDAQKGDDVLYMSCLGNSCALSHLCHV